MKLHDSDESNLEWCLRWVSLGLFGAIIFFGDKAYKYWIHDEYLSAALAGALAFLVTLKWLESERRQKRQRRTDQQVRLEKDT